jgi:hypothetical protein
LANFKKYCHAELVSASPLILEETLKQVQGDMDLEICKGPEIIKGKAHGQL